MHQTMPWCLQKKAALRPTLSQWSPIVTWILAGEPRCGLRIRLFLDLRISFIILHLLVVSKSAKILCIYNISNIYNLIKIDANCEKKREKYSYQVNSWYLDKGEDISDQEKPLGQQRHPIWHEILEHWCLSLVSKSPISRNCNAEKCRYHYTVTK